LRELTAAKPFEPFFQIERLHCDFPIVRQVIFTICLVGANGQIANDFGGFSYLLDPESRNILHQDIRKNENT
jgi:hypothetical protein